MTFHYTTEKLVSVEYNEVQDIRVADAVHSRDTGHPYSWYKETNGFEDEFLITDDLLQANESSVDISNGVSAKILCIHNNMYIYS